MWWSGNFDGWIWMTLMMAMMWAPIVLVIVWVMWSSTRRERLDGGGGGDPSVAALRLSYARGEISRERYLQALEDLGAPSSAPAERDARGR
jgi:uncharacterized membrane protein